MSFQEVSSWLTLMQSIEKEVLAERGSLSAPAAAPQHKVSRQLSSLLSKQMLPRIFVGSFVLIVINTLLYGFVTWLPTFFVNEGMTIAKSFGFALIMSFGAPIGAALGAFTADRWGRKPMIIGASAAAAVFGAIYAFVRDPVLLPIVGLLLVIPVYVLVALLFGMYVPELFPTEVRLRASGICNTFGRGATIGTPFLVVALYGQYGVAGVLALMVGLLLLQIVLVAFLGIESSKRGLEALSSSDSPEGATPVAAHRPEVSL